MSGNKYLLDTNIILYILGGDQTIGQYLHLRTLFTSVISEIEVMGYKNLTASEEKKIAAFLAQFRIIYIDDVIKKEAITIRKEYNLKLPDCIIAATAISLDLTLISADRQFRQVKNLPLEIYEP